jgi:hypothetical protein
MDQIEFGDEVRCKVTGFRGIATARIRLLHGEDQVAIQPPCNDKGEIPDPSGIDESLLEVVAKGKVTIVPKNGFQETDIDVGDEVVDPLTEFSGYVTNLTTFANGCKLARVRARKTEKDFIPSETFNVGRLKKVQRAEAPKKEKEVRTGGPSSAIERRSE